MIDDVRRMDNLINAQNRVAIATLASAIIQARQATTLTDFITAVSDAEHIIGPVERSNSLYKAWRERNGLDNS